MESTTNQWGQSHGGEYAEWTLHDILHEESEPRVFAKSLHLTTEYPSTESTVQNETETGPALVKMEDVSFQFLQHAHHINQGFHHAHSKHGNGGNNHGEAMLHHRELNLAHHIQNGNIAGELNWQNNLGPETRREPSPGASSMSSEEGLTRCDTDESMGVKKRRLSVEQNDSLKDQVRATINANLIEPDQILQNAMSIANSLVFPEDLKRQKRTNYKSMSKEEEKRMRKVRKELRATQKAKRERVRRVVMNEFFDVLQQEFFHTDESIDQNKVLSQCISLVRKLKFNYPDIYYSMNPEAANSASTSASSTFLQH